MKSTRFAVHVAIVFEVIFAVAAHAAPITWTGAADNSGWHVAGNWDLNRVPAGGDAVTIPDIGATTVVVFSTGVTTIDSLTCSEALSITGGTLTLVGSANSTRSVTLNGGTLSGGTWTITGAGNGIVALTNTNSAANGVTLVGELLLPSTNSRVKIGVGTTFTTARLQGFNCSMGFAPGATMTGTIFMEGAATGSRLIEMNGTSGTLTVAPTGSIRTGPDFSTSAATQIGGAFVFGGNMTLINEGTITAETSGTTQTINAPTFTNNGTLSTSNGGILTVSSASWTNNDTLSVNNGTLTLSGTFSLDPASVYIRSGGTVNLSGTLNNTALTLNSTTGSWGLNGGTISGGTLTFAGGQGLIINSSPSNLLTGVAISGGDIVLGVTNARLRIGPGTSFPTARLQGFNCSLGFVPGATITGTVFMEGAATGSRLIEMNGTSGTLTVASTGAIRTGTDFSTSAATQIGGAFAFGGNMTLINEGTITAETSGTTQTINAPSFTNNGTLSASNGGVLTVSSASWTNNDTLSVNNGTLNLGGTFTLDPASIYVRSGGTVNLTGTLNNTALTLNSTTGSWGLNGGAISGGTLTFASGQGLTVSSSTANLLTGVAISGGDIVLGVTNARLKIGPGTSFPTLRLQGFNCSLGLVPGATITGTVFMEGAATGTRLIEMNGSNGTVTVGPTGAIRTGPDFSPSAATQIGGAFAFGGNMTLINEGTITAETSGTTQTINAPSFTNNGTLSASNGGILAVSSPLWTNNDTLSVNNGTINLGGTFTLDPATTYVRVGGSINLTGTLNNTALTLNNITGSWNLLGGTISGGTLAFANGQGLTISSNSANLLTGVAISGGDIILGTTNSRVKIGPGTSFPTARLQGFNCSLGLVPGATITGTVFMEGAATGTRLIEMNGSNGTVTVGPTGAIRTGPDFNTSAATQIGGSFAFGGNMTLINEGTITAETSGTTQTINADVFTNNGTLSASNGGILAVSSPSWTNNDTLSVNNGTLRLGGTFTLDPASVYVRSGGTVNLTGTLNNTALTLNNATGSWTLLGGTVTGGTLTFANGHTLLITANANNFINNVAISGGDLLLNITGARTKIGGATSFSAARLSGNNCALGFAPGASIAGTIYMEGAAGGERRLEMNGTNGTVTLGPSGAIRTGPDLGAAADAVIGGSQWFGGNMTLINQGVISAETGGRTLRVAPTALTNNGTLQATSGATLRFSDPITQLHNNGNLSVKAGGLLNVAGNLTQNAAGTTSVEIGGPANAQFGRITLSGAATLAGTLGLSLVNGFVPDVVDRFRILTYGSHAGTYATVNGISISPTRKFDLIYGGKSHLLSVIVPGCETFVPCDMDCNGSVNQFDINGFVTSLSSPAGYAAQYPLCNRTCHTDTNGNGSVNQFDINGFLDCLSP